MTISVVMTTYNGEKYILEQLESIRKQSFVPNEVLICDDMSKDKTVEIIKNYIEKNKLSYSWKLIQNEENKGFIRNFIDAANLSIGEVIFFSDQDDIWDEEKIQKMTDVISENNAEAVCCSCDWIGPNGDKMPNIIGILNKIKIKKGLKSLSLKERIKYALSPGLCLCFKRTILEEITLICKSYNLPHDLPVGLIAAMHGRYYFLNEALVHHRIHSSNTSSPKTTLSSFIKNKERQLSSRLVKQEELKLIEERYSNIISASERKKIRKAIEVNTDMIKNLENEDLFGFIRACFAANSYFDKFLLLRNIIFLVKSKLVKEENL